MLNGSKKHGHAPCGKPASKTYHSWMAMRNRCGTPGFIGYENYGGKGVKVCDRWRDSFLNFLSDMGERPEGKTLDRYPDKNGDYEPGNCRWATYKEQSNNKSSNRIITVNGEPLPLAEWAKRANVTRGAIYQRVKRRQITFEEAVISLIGPQA